MVVVQPPAHRDTRAGDQIGVMLMSDTHLLGVHTDHDAVKADLDLAKENGWRIAINGDIFDNILPADRKRFDGQMHPVLAGRSSPLNTALEWGTDFFAPYAPLIDMIGCGNHDTATEKWHQVDIVKLLVERLNAFHGGNATYGGYEGYIRYTFWRKNKTRSYWIRFHHGFGGAAPVTKGMIDFNRALTWIADADAVWFGHKHNRWVDSTVLRERITNQGTVYPQPVLCIATASYLDTRPVQTPEGIMRDGRRGSWAAEKGLAPQRKGGIPLILTLRSPDDLRIDARAIL